ncbi:MAG: biopolymer transport protein TolR [Synergistaceae bacterium]|nr:biopolymer transport protein TolR [Synergistaceae bacterium]MDI3532138.1 biopolymer transport protein TolR [Synergistaceae bacterium]
MRHSTKRRGPDVDLTPLVDTLFMLILFFVLTAAFVQGRIDVNLPQVSGSSIAGTPNVIVVQKDGSLLWNGKPARLEEVSNLARSASDEGQPILIAGDEETNYGAVVSVLDSLQRVGIENVSLAVGGESP